MGKSKVKNNKQPIGKRSSPQNKNINAIVVNSSAFHSIQWALGSFDVFFKHLDWSVQLLSTLPLNLNTHWMTIK